MTAIEREKTAIIYNGAHVDHKPSTTSSPENPERLVKTLEYLKNSTNVFDESCILFTDFQPATEQDALLVHEMRYINFIKDYCKKGGGFLGDSTYLTKATYNQALLAAGGAIFAAELVSSGRYKSSFALIRPPGHHASSNSYGGYCILNNAAILARHLQKNKNMERIMIIDWDVHAADGTMKIFYEDPSVLTVSLHQDPIDFYPHNGFIRQIGAKAGRGTNVNIVLPKTSGDDEYMLAIKDIVLPLYEQFAPDFVVGCNGFDAHFSDLNSNMRMTCEGYYKLVRKLRQKMLGKFTILLEGGYTEYNGKLTHSIIAALTNDKMPYKREIDIHSDSLFKEDKTRTTFQKNLEHLKFVLLGHYKF